MGDNEKPTQQNPTGPKPSSDLSAPCKRDAGKQGETRIVKED